MEGGAWGQQATLPALRNSNTTHLHLHLLPTLKAITARLAIPLLTRQDVDGAGGDARLLKDGCHAQRVEGGLLRGLQHDAVAGGQGGGHPAGRDEEAEKARATGENSWSWLESRWSN